MPCAASHRNDFRWQLEPAPTETADIHFRIAQKVDADPLELAQSPPKGGLLFPRRYAAKEREPDQLRASTRHEPREQGLATCVSMSALGLLALLGCHTLRHQPRRD
jgi:hypothetical protein